MELARERVLLQKIIEERNGHEALFSLNLGGYPEQAGDEPDLTENISFIHPLHLSFPHEVYDFISLEGSPRTLKRKEAHPRLDESFDKAMILFDQIVEILALPQLTPFWNGSLRLQLLKSLWIGRVFVDRDDARNHGVAST